MGEGLMKDLSKRYCVIKGVTTEVMSGRTTLKVRGLGIRHSNIYCVTAKNYPTYLRMSKENRIWNGHVDCEDYVADYDLVEHLVKDDPRIRIYLRQVESLSLDKKDKTLSTLLVKFRESYKPSDLLSALKRQDQIPLEDCLDFLPKTYESSQSVYAKTLRIKFEAGHWLSGHKKVYVSARSIYAAYKAWLDVVPNYTNKKYLSDLVAGKTSYLTPYYKDTLMDIRNPNRRRSDGTLPAIKRAPHLTICQENILMNMWCHATMNEAGQYELDELLDEQIIRSTSYVYNPIQPAPQTTINKRLSQLRLPRQ